MEEIYRNVNGYEGIYQVSNLGNVRSVDRILPDGRFQKGITLKQGLHKKGYNIVYLSKFNKQKTITVHRLVANAFIENTYNKPCIDHINGVITDNNYTNLRWCTNKENVNFELSKKNRAKSSRRGKDSPLSIKVQKISLEGDIVGMYDSVSEASRASAVSSSKICAVCNGIRKTAGGYKWEYISEPKVKVVRPYKSRARKEKRIVRYDINGNFLDIFDSVHDASIKTGLDRTCISRNLNRFKSNVDGYVFKYKDDIIL